MPDALSRLSSRDYRAETEESVLDTLYEHYCYAVSLVQISDEFHKNLLQGYQNGRWQRIIEMVKTNDNLEDDNAATLPYKLVDNLLYFDDSERGLRLCIPENLEKQVFQLAHDALGHPGYARTHERLTDRLLVLKLSTKLHKYIRHCPQCQINQTPRHRLYSALQPIISPARPFHTMTLDFILGLPKSVTDDNTILSVTDKFSKAVTFIEGKDTFGSKEWSDVLLTRLETINWGIPSAIISDRDRKFLSDLWKDIFLKLHVNLIYSTAWHPQTDGISERSNQTAEITLRYFIAELVDNRI